MLKVITAHSAWPAVSPLVLNLLAAEGDLFKVSDIQGLGPVNAAIGTSPLGSVDGATFVGATVGTRNIVLTIQPNPNWTTWTPTKLRQELYKYFMPKQAVRLVFDTDEYPDVEITGYVETNEPDIFSKTGEIVVSIICPYPYFRAVTATVVNGVSNAATNHDYTGTVETGFVYRVTWTSGGGGAIPRIRVGPNSSEYSTWLIAEYVNSGKYMEFSSVRGEKYVRRVEVPSGVVTNILDLWLDNDPEWPALKPGNNYIYWFMTGGVNAWTLTYYKRYGGL